MTRTHIDQSLRRTGRRAMVIETFRAMGLGVAVLVTALLIAMCLDALLALAPAGLLMLDALLIVLILAAGLYVARIIRRHRYDPRRFARLIEQRLGVTDNRLINAVELAAQAGQPAVALSGGVSPRLAAMTVEQGARFAAEVDPRRVVDRRGLNRALIAAATALILLFVAYTAAPAMFYAVLPRLLAPTADHPPFTLVRFDVRVEPQPVYYGQPATIVAQLAGPVVPQNAAIVFVGDSTDAANRVPMMRGTEGRFVLPLERAEGSRRFYIDTPEGRSELHELRVLMTPKFQRVEVRYDFPAYTGWPPSLQEQSGGEIRALKGTTITLRAHANVPLREGELKLTDAGGQAVALIRLIPDAADASVVTGSFTLEQTGHYHVGLIGRDGTPSAEERTGSLAAVDDAPPAITLAEPDAEIIAPENWPVKVRFDVKDDVGIGRVVIHRSVNGFATAEAPLTLEPGGSAARASAIYTFDLAALGARGGDVIRYYGSVFDNYPDAPHSADSSPVAVIHVISAEQYKAALREDYGIEQILNEIDDIKQQLEQLDKQRDELIEQLEALEKKMQENGGQLSDEDQRKLDELRKQLADYADKSKELADKAEQRAGQSPLYEFEQLYLDDLKKLAEQLGEQAAGAQKSAQQMQRPQGGQPRPAPQAKQAVDDALQRLKKDGEQSEQAERQMDLTEQDVRKLELADRMVEQLERILAVGEQQRDVADRMSKFRQKQSLNPIEQAQADQLAEQQSKLRDELADAQQQLQQLADKAESDLPKMAASARKIAGDIESMQITPDQSAASEHAQSGRGSQAHAAAASAADKLQLLIKENNCQSCQGQAADSLDGALALSRGQLTNSLSQLAQGRAMRNASGKGQGQGQGQDQGQGQGISGFGSGLNGGNSGGRMQMVGPPPPSMDGRPRRPSDSGRQGGDRAGTGRTADENPFDSPDAAERITPDSATGRAGGQGGLSGVPLKYQPLAELYFRRLAEENRK